MKDTKDLVLLYLECYNKKIIINSHIIN